MTPIPEDLLRFIDENVESVDHLEILRNVGENRHKQWSSAELSAAAQVTPAALAGHLATLERRGLIKVNTSETQPTCIYAPRSPEIAATLDRLLQLYKERPVTLIQTVYSRANERLKAFTEAFRLRKEP